MPILSTTKRTRIRVSIAKKEASLAIAQDTLDEILANQAQEYRFDSNEGSQRMEYKKISDLERLIEKLEAQIDWLYRKLEGGNVVELNMRRKGW